MTSWIRSSCLCSLYSAHLRSVLATSFLLVTIQTVMAWKNSISLKSSGDLFWSGSLGPRHSLLYTYMALIALNWSLAAHDWSRIKTTWCFKAASMVWSGLELASSESFWERSSRLVRFSYFLGVWLLVVRWIASFPSHLTFALMDRQTALSAFCEHLPGLAQEREPLYLAGTNWQRIRLSHRWTLWYSSLDRELRTC